MANPPGFVSNSGFAGQSGRFFSVYLGAVRVGGLQNVRYSESFGTHWVGEIGSDHKEPEFGMRQVSGSADRLTLNLHKLRDILQFGQPGGDATPSDIDLRNFQFTLKINYHEKYILPDGITDSGIGLNGAGNAATLSETINQVMFTDISISLNDPTSLAREDVTFIGTSVGVASAQIDQASQSNSNS